MLEIQIIENIKKFIKEQNLKYVSGIILEYNQNKLNIFISFNACQTCDFDIWSSFRNTFPHVNISGDLYEKTQPAFIGFESYEDLIQKNIDALYYRKIKELSYPSKEVYYPISFSNRHMEILVENNQDVRNYLPESIISRVPSDATYLRYNSDQNTVSYEYQYKSSEYMEPYVEPIISEIKNTYNFEFVGWIKKIKQDITKYYIAIPITN